MIELKVKENAGYKFIAQASVPFGLSPDEYLIVLGEQLVGDKLQYVTWISLDGENFNHGHYITDKRAALNDFVERVEREARMPSPYDRWMKEEIEHRVKEFAYFEETEYKADELLKDSDFMYLASEAVRSVYEDNWRLGDMIYDALREAYSDVFEEVDEGDEDDF